MKKFALMAAAATLTLLSATSALAHPQSLTVFNNINSFSNAQLHGQFTPDPIPAFKPAKFSWNDITQLCNGGGGASSPPIHKDDNLCVAAIYAKVKTPAPVDVGFIVINLDTGYVFAHNKPHTGYRITANHAVPGFVTLSKSS